MEELLKCDICKIMFNLSNHKPLTAKCGHTFCKHCVLSSKDENNKSSCPLCSTPFLLNIESCIPNLKLEQIIQTILNKETQSTKKIVYIKPDIKRNRSPIARTKFFSKDGTRQRSNTTNKYNNEFNFTKTHCTLFGSATFNINSPLIKVYTNEEKNKINETIETIPFNDDKSVNLSFRDECKELLEDKSDEAKINNKEDMESFKEDKEKEIINNKEENDNATEGENNKKGNNNNIEVKSTVYSCKRINRTRERNKRIYFNNNINNNTNTNTNNNLKNSKNNVNVKIQNINIINTSPQHEPQTLDIYQEYQTVPNKIGNSECNTPEKGYQKIDDKSEHNGLFSSPIDYQRNSSKISTNNNDNFQKNNKDKYCINSTNTNRRYETYQQRNSPVTTSSTIGSSPKESPSRNSNSKNNNNNNTPPSQADKVKALNTLKSILSKFFLSSSTSSLSNKRKYEEYLTKAINNKIFFKDYSSLTIKLFQNGDFFVGYIDSNTSKASNGILFASNGDYYEGAFSNDKKEGYGVLIYKNGTRYEGDLKNNKHNGYGKLIQLDGEVFIGEWKEGKINGHGVRYHSNGDRYIGNYVNNIRNGNGKYIFSNGDTYDGNWVDGKANGKGKFVFKNGNIYEGEFRDNLIMGEGIFNMNNGDVYKGRFQNGLINGKGEVINKSGEKYQGEFYNGKKHGFGKVYNKEDKLLYSGFWNMDNYLGNKGYNE